MPERLRVCALGPGDGAFGAAVRELARVPGVEIVADAGSADAVLAAGDAGAALAPPYGVWAFRDDAVRAIREGDTATAGQLVRLGDGAVLQQCHVAAKPWSLAKTRDAVAWGSAYMPARAARDILERGGARTVAAEPLPAAGRLDLVARARMARAWVRVQLDSILRVERWHVGIVRAPIERFLEPGFRPEIEWVGRPRRGGFLADPFLAGPSTLLVEDFDDRAGRGTIAEIDLATGRRRTAIDAGCHMAYPYVFEHEGRLYCTPETHERRGVYLYERDGSGWAERACLLDGVAAVDPTVIEHDGRWWLFCTDEEADSEGRLLLFCAPELLGPWHPHPGNPVKTDIRSSRPAGTPFVAGGALHRPAQDSASTYGSAVVINRITTLTETEFAEEPVVRLGPPPGSSHRAGFHTLAGLGDLTAVDGKRRELAPRLVLPRLARKVRRLTGRGRPSRSSS